MKDGNFLFWILFIQFSLFRSIHRLTNLVLTVAVTISAFIFIFVCYAFFFQTLKTETFCFYTQFRNTQFWEFDL
jgi:hypothetical protein